MAVRKVEETQTETGTWAADSGGISTDLIKNGAITRIKATAEVTPSGGGLAGANQPNGLFRVVQNLRIAGGSHTYFTLPADDAAMGGVLLHYLNQYDGFGLGHTDASVAAPSRTYSPVTFVYHCGSRPKDKYGRDNKFDLTAFIPSTLESRLTAVWVTSGNDVMDDTITISSAVMRYTVSTVLGAEADLLQEMAHQEVMTPPGVKAMIPAWTAEVFQHTATASDYSGERNVPTGGWLKRIVIVEQDDTATRSVRAQDEVTGVAIKLAKDGSHLLRVFVDQMLASLPPGSVLEADDAALDFGVHAPEGIFIIDLRPHVSYASPAGRDYGLDLTRYNIGSGDVKLGLTITNYTAGDDSLIVYENYLPIPDDHKHKIA